MAYGYFFGGMAAGLAMAVPVGPVGVWCIRRSLRDGNLAGWLAGLGAALADAFYGVVAAYSLTVASETLVDQQGALRLAGGVLLIVLGGKTWFGRPPDPAHNDNGRAHGPLAVAGDFFWTFFLTLTNPMTVVAFAAVFATMGVADVGDDRGRVAILVAGVFLGSATWWFVLSSAVGMFRDRFDTAWLVRLNRLSGGLLALIGVAMLAAAAGIMP